MSRSWQSCNGPDSFRSWLYQIIINIVRDSNKRQRFEQSEEVGFIESPDNVGKHLELLESHAIVDREIQRLPTRQREVFILIVAEEVSAEEAAEMLNINVGNVYATLHQAKQKLRERLSRLLPDWS